MHYPSDLFFKKSFERPWIALFLQVVLGKNAPLLAINAENLDGEGENTSA